jgi:hypothetical protein
MLQIMDLAKENAGLKCESEFVKKRRRFNVFFLTLMARLRLPPT